MTQKYVLALVGGLASASVIPQQLRPIIPQGEDCKIQYELAQLQDVTQSFEDDIAVMRTFVVDFVHNLTSSYPGSRFGLAPFGDKPVPYSGYGAFASTRKGFAWDFCYDTYQSLTDDAVVVLSAVNNLYTSGGNDVPENQFEAFLNVALDGEMGWMPYTHDPETGRPILRVAMMITDAVSHGPGQAQSNINRWNTNWGFVEMMDRYLFLYGECSDDTSVWADFVSLGPKYRADPTSLTADEQAKFATVLALCGPYPYPSVAEHPGTPPAACTSYDYPSATQMTNAVKAMNLIPVVLTPASSIGGLFEWMQSWDACPGAETEAQCLADWWRSVFFEAGIEGVFAGLEGGPSSMMEVMLRSLDQITEAYCLETTTTASPSTTAMSTITTSTTTGEDVSVSLEGSVAHTSELLSTTNTWRSTTSPTAYTTLLGNSTQTTTSTMRPCGCGSNQNCLCDGEIEIRVKNLAEFINDLK